MCGIAGLICTPDVANQGNLNAVRRMTLRMSSRGPDAEGIWKGQHVVLGHRRLAILDLDSRSNQPMHSPDRRSSIVFNGEIYNFRELRKELEDQGEVFHTTSDTEVLLSLYARYGEAMLPKLRGMFAFGIWQNDKQELFLARDAYGIKPLYYAASGQGFVFASQVKALLASGLVGRDIEPAGLAGFYLWGSVPEPWTLYKGVLSLPAGSWMRVRRGAATHSPVCWYDIRSAWNVEQVACGSEELQQRVRSAVTDAVRAHLVSDVPVSVFLSGGVDSGAVTGLVSQLGAKVKAVTVGFREFESMSDDEAPVASRIASHYGFEHEVRYFSRSEFEADLPCFIEAMDQPTIDGVNSWFASKAVAGLGYKVVLSGVGGDELFYGYPLAHEIPRSAVRNRWLTSFPGSRALLRAAIRRLPPGRVHPKVTGLPEFMGSLSGEYLLRRALFLPHELPELMDIELASEGLQRLGGSAPGIHNIKAVDAEGAVCMLDSSLYMRNTLLRDSDWTSMAHSLELRTPLVDSKLLQDLQLFHTAFKRGAGKRLLAHSPLKPLPAEVFLRPKTGFAVPMTQWLRQSTNLQNWRHSTYLSQSGTPWTRRWAGMVMDRFLSHAETEMASILAS
ncbi:MAG TPA: asparagine synthase (glutamine-hydrolyzing) [Terracidiphilus sp.]